MRYAHISIDHDEISPETTTRIHGQFLTWTVTEFEPNSADTMRDYVRETVQRLTDSFEQMGADCVMVDDNRTTLTRSAA
jgi:hypothetical protein